jgi:asparagine synthase (glutamine-hydrolysing)
MGEETLFKGIFSLEPGCSLTIENGVAHLRKYWIFPMVPENEKEDKGEAYYIQGVRELVSKAVERQLVSDVPLGAYLSGGLDSSIIVALMTLQTKRPVKTYAIGFPEEGFNEFRYSDQVASIWGADHTQITIEEEDYFKTILELIRFKDSPLSVPNEVPLYLMSKVLKERITVTISGEGSDELFGGYGGIMRSPFDYLRSLPNSIVPANQRRLLNKALMRLYGKTEFASELDHFLSVYCWMKSGELSVIFKPEVLEDCKNFISTRNFWQCQFSKLHSLDLYNKYLCLMETVHLPGLLGRLDTTTMAVGVEGRVPFTDTELLEFAANIPHRYKVHWNSPMYEDMCARLHSFEISEVMDTTKYILKRSFVDKVPPDVLFRKKYSFPVPLERWFSNGLLGEFLSEVEGPLPDYLDKKGLIEWVTTSNYPDKPLKIWMLLNLILWHKEYFTGIFEKLSLEENGQHILALK